MNKRAVNLLLFVIALNILLSLNFASADTDYINPTGKDIGLSSSATIYPAQTYGVYSSLDQYCKARTGSSNSYHIRNNWTYNYNCQGVQKKYWKYIKASSVKGGWMWYEDDNIYNIGVGYNACMKTLNVTCVGGPGGVVNNQADQGKNTGSGNTNQEENANQGNTNQENANQGNTNLPKSNVCSDASQTILSLSNSKNAHAETYDKGNYKTGICYDDLFGKPYTGNNPHLCTTNNGNLVVRLSSKTNSHAQIPEENTLYTTKVCYGDLVCRSVKTGLCNSAKEEREILRLYNDKNSHLAVSGTNEAGIPICCKSAALSKSACSLTDAYWSKTKAKENETVSLVVEGSNCDKEKISFVVKEKDLLWWDDVNTNPSKATFSGDKATGIWTAEYQKDIIGGPEYVFTATLVSDSSVSIKSSNQLEVEKLPPGEKPPETNNPPVPCINSPKNLQIYFVNEEISFSSCSTDPDEDTLNYKWDFGDGTTSDKSSTTHIFKTTGQKSIKLSVNDAKTKKETKVDVLIINSTFVGAFINEPSHNSQIIGESVNFDAGEKSFVIETVHDNSGEVIKINCLAGNCPQKTSGKKVINIDNTPNTDGIKDVYFSWSIDNGYKTSGLNKKSFSYKFSYPGNYKTEVNISWQEKSSSKHYVNFAVDFGVPYCRHSSDFTKSYWFEDGSLKSSENDCKRDDGEPTNYCCPLGETCKEESGGKWGCELGSSGINICNDYTSKSSCEADSNNVGFSDSESKLKSLYGSDAGCGKVITIGDGGQIETGNCGCVWDESNTDGKKCEAAWSERDIEIDQNNENGDGDGLTGLKGTCTIKLELTNDKCDSLEKTRTYEQTATWVWNSGSDEPEDYPPKQDCESKDGVIKTVECTYFSQVRLPFFTLFNFIVTFLMIAGFYLLRTTENKKKR